MSKARVLTTDEITRVFKIIYASEQLRELVSADCVELDLDGAE